MIENTSKFFKSSKRGRFGKNLTLVPLQFEDVLAILTQYNPKKARPGKNSKKKEESGDES